MNIINLTPHAINIYAAQRLVRTVEPSGTVARVAVERQLVAVDEQGIEFYTTAYGEPVNLPEPQPDTIYIVSGLLRNAVLDRVDLWQPGELLRNEAGQPIGCIGLQQ